MPEEVKESVEEAPAPAPESEVVQDDQTADKPIEQPTARSDVDHNWREARRKIETLEQKNYELESKLTQLQQPKASEEDDLSKIADDDIITAKQAKQLAQKMARQVADEAIRSREAQTVDERLQLKYPDFAQVVTKENIELLKTQEPEIAMSLYAMSHDPYAQSIAAYKIIKKHGLGVSDEVAKNKQKALENSKKPVSSQSAARSAAIANVSSFDGRLTAEMKAAYRKEMDEARKQI